MLRNLVGFAVFAIVAILAFKLAFGLFGLVLGLLMSLLWLAFIGWLIYLVIKVLSPTTADRIREVIRGRQALKANLPGVGTAGDSARRGVPVPLYRVFAGSSSGSSSLAPLRSAAEWNGLPGIAARPNAAFLASATPIAPFPRDVRAGSLPQIVSLDRRDRIDAAGMSRRLADQLGVRRPSVRRQ
jgi:hypothetical protein